MPFKITCSPINRISGVKQKTVVFETAAEAWAECQCLMASDEKVSITLDGGAEIEWQELKAMAECEVH